MRLSLGFSPCPNDCFIFDALVHHRIDTEGFEFDVQLLDVEALNRKAWSQALDITKLSFFAYAQVMDHYVLLRSGSALGFNCGPLLVARHLVKDLKNEIRRVAIPGRMTTANFLLTLALPDVKEKQEFVFSEIEDAVLDEKVDAGLIIHENRFTYTQKGLVKLMDLGEFWETQMHAPIPLGGIAAHRKLSFDKAQRISRLIRKSIEYAFNNPEVSLPYVKENAQAMSEEVMQKHISLYVNRYSVDLGEDGMTAVNTMFEKAVEMGLIAPYNKPLLLA